MTHTPTLPNGFSRADARAELIEALRQFDSIGGKASIIRLTNAIEDMIAAGAFPTGDAVLKELAEGK